MESYQNLFQDSTKPTYLSCSELGPQALLETPTCIDLNLHKLNNFPQPHQISLLLFQSTAIAAQQRPLKLQSDTNLETNNQYGKSLLQQCSPKKKKNLYNTINYYQNYLHVVFYYINQSHHQYQSQYLTYESQIFGDMNCSFVFKKTSKFYQRHARFLL